MSHWTRSKVVIKNLAKLKEVAERLGCQVQEGQSLKYSSSYAGTVDAVMILTHKNGGSAAVVKDKTTEDGYTTIMDNFSNPITNVVGSSCSKLCQEYTSDLVRDQAMLMGGIVSSENTLNDGSIEIRLTI